MKYSEIIKELNRKLDLYWEFKYITHGGIFTWECKVKKREGSTTVWKQTYTFLESASEIAPINESSINRLRVD